MTSRDFLSKAVELALSSLASVTNAICPKKLERPIKTMYNLCCIESGKQKSPKNSVAVNVSMNPIPLAYEQTVAQ